MRSFIGFALLLATSLLQAQDKVCQILDTKGQVVPYVNIYNPALQNGLIAGAEGTFTFEPADFPADDTLRFSCIGYETLTHTVSEVAQSSPCRITLNPKIYETITAEITDAAVSYRKRSAGIKARWKLYQYGYGVTKKSRGGEVGIFIPNESSCLIEQIGFNLTNTKPDSILLEVNIYEAVDSLPGKPLQKSRIFTHAVANKSTVIDLSTSPVRVTGAFFVTLEFLHDRDTEKGFVLFKAKRNSPYLTVVRKADGSWEKEQGLSPSIYAQLQCIAP
jgi:hypothetical protein